MPLKQIWNSICSFCFATYVFETFLSRCYDSNAPHVNECYYFIFFECFGDVTFFHGEDITPAEIVFQFRRYDLYNSQRSCYLGVNLHGISIAPGVNIQVKCCVYFHSLDSRRKPNDIIDTKRFLYPHWYESCLKSLAEIGLNRFFLTIHSLLSVEILLIWNFEFFYWSILHWIYTTVLFVTSYKRMIYNPI